MSAKPGELKVRWSKKENDFLIEWGDGTGKANGGWINDWVTFHVGFNNNLAKEMESRGFDPKSLRIYMRKKVP